MTRALVTGFEPFGGANVNASQKLVEALASEPPDGLELATAVLPVVWVRAEDELVRALERVRPELVVCFGQADGRAHVEVERFALNFDEGSDEAGETRRAEIVTSGPVAYRSSLAVDAVVDELRAEGIPAAASRDAGGFLCNHVFYVLLRALRDGQVGGFVHVPPLDVVPVEQLERAGRVIVSACERHISPS